MVNVVDLDGMDPDHVVVEEHVLMPIQVIPNVYHLVPHRAARRVQRQQHFLVMIDNQV